MTLSSVTKPIYSLTRTVDLCFPIDSRLSFEHDGFKDDFVKVICCGHIFDY